MAKPPVKAQQLAEKLADLIRSGCYPPGQWLPPERQLVETHGAVRSTVRQAVQMLAEAGIVERHEGAGARVLAIPASPVLDAADIHGELAAIRSELQQMNARLRALEERSAP